jgi:hypothetical protein
MMPTPPYGETWQRPDAQGNWKRTPRRDHRTSTLEQQEDSWEEKARGHGRGVLDWLKEATKSRADNEFREVDPTGAMGYVGGEAGKFANESQGRFLDDSALRGQLQRQMSGEQSLSAEQLRQGLGQNLAAQQSMAAGARGGNQAMAARTAAMNSANLGAGLSGQQAMAGIAERQAAAQGLAGLRGQDLQATLGGRGQALDAFGQIEQQRGNRFDAMTQTPSGAERGLSTAGGVIGGIGALFSDVRAKTAIDDGSGSVQRFLGALQPASYRYRDPAQHGGGRHVGIMAQDLERTPEGASMVSDTPGGKQIDGGKLTGAIAAATADLNRRIEELEREKKMKGG